MAQRVYTATEKASGRTYLYQVRRTFGRREFAIPYRPGCWFPKLSMAKAAAKAVGRFRYDDEPALVTVDA